MQKYLATLVMMALIGFSISSHAADQKDEDIIQSDIRELKQEIKATTNDVEMLRRDQLNYKIEKDILKEAYSSNLQAINIVITIVLGVIGVLGYLGIRSIKEVQADYVKELDEIKKIKHDFEVELKSWVEKLREIEGRIGDLTVTNEVQDRRLKVLELTEKVSGLMNNKQWRWALEYIPVGLEIDKNNEHLLSQKAICHGKLGEFSSAIEASRKIIEVNPANSTAKANKLEFIALSGQEDEFEKVYRLYKSDLDQYGGNSDLIDYLKIIMFLMSGNVTAAVNGLKSFLTKYPEGARKLLGTWSFDEVVIVAKKMPEGTQRNLILNMVNFFDGKMPSEDLTGYLATVKS